MNKYSVVLEDIVWTLPNLTDRQLAGALLPSFSTVIEVDHTDENLVEFIAVSRCEREAECTLRHGDYRASVCLIEESVVN